jgi:hypothetical protein
MNLASYFAGQLWLRFLGATARIFGKTKKIGAVK